MVGAESSGPLTLANGVVYFPSLDPEGHMFFLDASSGRLLGSFKGGSSTNSGPSVVNGRVYFGVGYTSLKKGTKGRSLLALGLPV